MTPTSISDIAAPLKYVTAAQANSALPQSGESGLTGVRAVAAPDTPQLSVDTVSLSDRSRQPFADGRRDQAAVADEKKQETKKEGSESEKAGGKPDRTIAKVQFVYTMKGTLRMRYLDTASRLIYQVPSELMLQLREAMANSGSLVNTKA